MEPEPDFLAEPEPVKIHWLRLRAITHKLTFFFTNKLFSTSNDNYYILDFVIFTQIKMNIGTLLKKGNNSTGT